MGRLIERFEYLSGCKSDSPTGCPLARDYLIGGIADLVEEVRPALLVEGVSVIGFDGGQRLPADVG